MPRTKLSEYSTTNTDNSDIESINISEGCAPSGINNAIRELMVHLKEFQTGASGDAFTFAGGVLISGTTNTISGAAVISGNINSSGTNTFSGTTVMSGANTISHAAGTVSLPSITVNGDTNTGIFFPAADTIAFAEGGAEAMRINSSSNVGIGTTSPVVKLHVAGDVVNTIGASYSTNIYYDSGAATNKYIANGYGGVLTVAESGDGGFRFYTAPSNSGGAGANATITERMRIDSSGNVGIGTSSPQGLSDSSNNLHVASNATTKAGYVAISNSDNAHFLSLFSGNSSSQVAAIVWKNTNPLLFGTYTNITGSSFTERARITSDGYFLVGKTTTNFATQGVVLNESGESSFTRSSGTPMSINRTTNDGTLISFAQDGTGEGSISVSGNTVSYNAFCGGHWSQLQEGRGYNPEIPRGTVMSSIGEMAEWKSVTWTETIEHPAITAVEAKEAVLDGEGNVVEPAVEAVEGKDAWTESIPHRKEYLGNLPIGATFEENGFTKTVVDDGNERLPKVKISDVVGDKAVYGVFQTWDDAQDMLVSSLGAFVVRIAAGVTVQIGDLLESNGDGCAKVQDDDVIRSKTIGKVTSTVATATYADGSYTVPCVLYCG